MVAGFKSLGHEVHVYGLATVDGRPARHGLVHRLKRILPSAVFELASIASNVPDALHMRRAVRANRPHFLYKRHARYDVGALYAARHAGIPAVLEINCLFTGAQYHQFEPMAFGRLAARLERRALELADVVLAVSTPLAREIERLYGVTAVVVPNGADPERFNPARTDGSRIRSRYGLGGQLIVGWAGVMRQWHGLDLLLNAMASVPDLRLLIVGDGPSRSVIERHAAATGLAERTVITGRVPPEEMPDHLAAMDIAVVASDGTGVASPMKLLEYMAMERAVVAPRIDNIRDLVTDEHSGLLFTPGSADDLGQALHRLSQDERLRLALGREARRTVQERRNWRSNAERVLALVHHRTAEASQHA
jgi:glycosyltransferase involved in cell wall biosynthesis